MNADGRRWIADEDKILSFRQGSGQVLSETNDERLLEAGDKKSNLPCLLCLYVTDFWANFVAFLSANNFGFR